MPDTHTHTHTSSVFASCIWQQLSAHPTRKSALTDPPGSLTLTLDPALTSDLPCEEFSKHHRVNRVALFPRTIKHARLAEESDSSTVCKRNTCAAVYLHIWQRFARVSVPGFLGRSDRFCFPHLLS